MSAISLTRVALVAAFVVTSRSRRLSIVVFVDTMVSRLCCLLPFLFQPGNLGCNAVGGTVIWSKRPVKPAKSLNITSAVAKLGLPVWVAAKASHPAGTGKGSEGGTPLTNGGGSSPSSRALKLFPVVGGGNIRHWQGWVLSKVRCYHLKTRANWFGEKGKTPFVVGRVTQLVRIFVRGRRGPSRGRIRWCSEWGRTYRRNGDGGNAQAGVGAVFPAVAAVAKVSSEGTLSDIVATEAVEIRRFLGRP